MTHRRRMRALMRGKTRRVGFWEALALRRAGRRDGTLGQLKKTEDGRWQSAFLTREIDSCEEFCSTCWSLFQVENEAAYARLEELTAVLPRTRARLLQARRDLADSEPDDSYYLRRQGEESLSADQVRARRERELEKLMAPLLARVMGLEQELNGCTEEFTRLCCRLEEHCNTIRIGVHRVQEHVRQRLEVYWNAASECHPEQLPPVSGSELTDRAGEAYEKLHRELKEKARRLQQLALEWEEAA